MASYRQMTERLMSRAGTIARERESDITESILREAAEEIKSNGRKPAPEPPEGGISLSEASRKYKVVKSTLSRWVSKGYIPVKLRTNREVYIDEAALADLVKKYRQNPGQGKKTAKSSK